MCAELSALTAIALIASDSPGPARRFWRTAIRAADQTKDHELQARIRGRRAVFALYDDLPVTTALTLAEDAVTVSDGQATAGSASGYAARAQGLAQLGLHNDARRALSHLEATFDRLETATIDDRRSQWGWGQQRLLHVASFVYAHAGDTSRATQAQESALALYPTQLYQGRAQIELHRATCLVAVGDPIEGARHTIRTLTSLTSPRRHDALIRRSAQHVVDAIPANAAHDPAVCEARHMLTSMATRHD
ncbi:hypothetical protein [Dactylosporangium darangshiense]|uniref:Transcriptional regulator n=1 Tax=Dactylosporangium darangshiense TaxID=579108 RepID=A0ABP8DS67_9ACTN